MGFVLFCSSGNEPDITHLSGRISLPSSLASSCLHLLSPSLSLFSVSALSSLSDKLFSCFFILSLLSFWSQFFAWYAPFFFLLSYSSWYSTQFFCICSIFSHFPSLFLSFPSCCSTLSSIQLLYFLLSYCKGKKRGRDKSVSLHHSFLRHSSSLTYLLNNPVPQHSHSSWIHSSGLYDKSNTLSVL